MRVLIISDIHANFTALEAVLADAASLDYEAVWCLGDLVGYGPQPNECIERVRALRGLVCLVGNHDKAVLGELDVNAFNHDARAAIQWTGDTLTAENLAYLKALQPADEIGEFTLAHASPRQPIWEYILNRYIARDNFAYFDTPFCLVGHTHVPVIFHEPGADGECGESLPEYGAVWALDGQRLIINPGSVGQPRDSNPDAAYALLDTAARSWEYRRVPYDVGLTQSQMRAAHFPERLIIRIAYGW
ncbi:MAG: metallophosphoesterase family protein [Anaerolineales bacterium]|nr:metallophosphoesterase family protein [Anaerolineales bacterium]